MEEVSPEQMLQDAADLYNEIRSHLNALYMLRQAHPGLIAGSDFHAIVQASMWMDRKAYCRILSGIVGCFNRTNAGRLF